METADMIPASEFCIHYNIELSFIDSLRDAGLIETVKTGDNIFVPLDELPHLEKMVRLYYEMDINVEGIETITCLLQRMNEMQRQIALLQSKLALYEQDEPY
jgi:hypothetical protein